MAEAPRNISLLTSEDVEHLNSLIAAEWGLVRGLRILEAETSEEGLRHVLKRLRNDSVANTANLTRLVRAAGGHPIDIPGPLGEQIQILSSFSDKLACFRQAQQRQRADFSAAVANILHSDTQEALTIFSQLHAENALWLDSVLKQ